MHVHKKLEDELLWLGHIRVRELPSDWDLATFKFWWKHFSEQEKDRYTVAEAHNLITSVGRTQILTFIGSPTANTGAFGQYFAVGNFPINIVQPGDSGIAGEVYRAVPSSFTVTGNTVDLSTFCGNSQGNGILTNCGIYGINATSSTGTGTLMTHALLNNYSKTSAQVVTFDYLITLN